MINIFKFLVKNTRLTSFLSQQYLFTHIFLDLRGYAVKFGNFVNQMERQMKRGTRRLAFRVHGTRSKNWNAGTRVERGDPLERSGSNTD